MIKLSLQSAPVQQFTFNQGDYRYEFTVRFIGEAMTYDLSINEVVILSGFRFVIGQLMIPYKYLEADGNFILVTQKTEEPDYLKFGVSQFLYYLSKEEAEEFRIGRS